MSCVEISSPGRSFWSPSGEKMSFFVDSTSDNATMDEFRIVASVTIGWFLYNGALKKQLRGSMGVGEISCGNWRRSEQNGLFRLTQKTSFIARAFVIDCTCWAACCLVWDNLRPPRLVKLQRDLRLDTSTPPRDIGTDSQQRNLRLDSIGPSSIFFYDIETLSSENCSMKVSFTSQLLRYISSYLKSNWAHSKGAVVVVQKHMDKGFQGVMMLHVYPRFTLPDILKKG